MIAIGVAWLSLGCTGGASPVVPNDTTDIINKIPYELASEPSWSPNGAELAYTYRPRQVRQDSFPQIWRYRLTDSTTALLAIGSDPAWSPAGTHIAYTFNRDIWLLDIASRTQRQITHLGACFQPSWNLSGDTLVYWRGRSGVRMLPPDSVGIWGIDVTTLGETQYCEFGTDPTSSPNGETIAFVYNEQLWRLTRSSGIATQLTFNAFTNRTPAWTADGSHLLWTANEPALTPRYVVWAMASNGTFQNRLIMNARSPAYSPVGGVIAVAVLNDTRGEFTLWLATDEGKLLAPIPVS